MLVAFLLLIFWGVLGQAGTGENSAMANERFFDSYFLWAMGVVPLPALKGLAVMGAVHLFCSLFFRMPRICVSGGLKNLGLWGMHVALIFLLAGGIAESELKKEYTGFRAASEPQKEISFFEVSDSLNTTPIQIADGYPYYVFHKGQVDMFGLVVDVYSATYDPLKFVPYVFSVLFLLSVFLHYFFKERARPSKKIDENKMTLAGSAKILAIVGMVLLYAPSAHAVGNVPYYETDAVVVDGEIRVFDSFARGVLNEIYGKVSYGNLSAVEFVRNVSQGLSDVDEIPIFKVLRNDALNALRLTQDRRYVSYNELNIARSQLEIYASRSDGHPTTAEMKRLLANMQLYEALGQGLFPKADSDENFKRRASLEVFYNKVNFGLVAFIFAFAGFMLAAFNSAVKKRFLDVASNVASGAVSVALACAFVLRFYITKQPPLSSLYEIVLLVALLLEAFEFGAFVFCKKRTFTLMIPVTAMAAMLLFFAKFILEPGDLFSPVPAILNSSIFLTLHVFTIALGFAGVILSGVVAHVVLWRTRKNLDFKSSSIFATFSLMRGTLIFGFAFTVLGTLLGGVWADFAWGRFWGFDPKECGALFVILWTMLGLHLRAALVISDRGFALFNAFNIIVTFLCWFGINLLGVGLHSYGFQNGTAVWLATFVVADGVAIALIGRKCS